jgi:hypothetical protein
VQLVASEARAVLTTDLPGSFAPISQDDAIDDVLDTPPLRDTPLHLQSLFNRNEIDVPAQVNFLSHLTLDGFRYAVRTKHEGNSNLLITDAGGKLVPVSIEHILRLPGQPRDNAWMVVKRLRPIAVVRDPFLDFPLLRAKMWSAELSDELELIDLTMIESHFAKCSFRWEGKIVALVISLSKVSFYGSLDLLFRLIFILDLTGYQH